MGQKKRQANRIADPPQKNPKRVRSATNTLSTMPHVLEPQVDYDKLATAILKQSNYRSSSGLPQPTTSSTLLPSEEPSNSATTIQSSHSDSTASLSQPTTSAGAKDNFPQQDQEVEFAFHPQPVSSKSGLGSLIDQIFKKAKSPWLAVCKYLRT